MVESRKKDIKMMERTPEGWRGAAPKDMVVTGSQLSIDPLTLTTRMAAKSLVAKLCEGAEWHKYADGFGFKIPVVTGTMMKEIAREARAIMGTEYDPGDSDGKKSSRVSFLTRTSKMGCYSFNLPAGPPEFGGACPASGIGFLYRQEKHKHEHGAKETFEYPDWEQFVPNKAEELDTRVHTITKQKWICNACYALKGNYAYTSNVIGQLVKLGMVKKMLQPGGWKGRDFASYMLEAIEWGRKKSMKELRTTPAQLLHHIPHPDYFRIHDAGDFFREEYWYQWVAVMDALPDVHFWAPTRMWALKKPLRYLLAGPIAGNLALRPSALHFGDPAPTVTGLAKGASSAQPDKVPPTVWSCPAYDQEHLYGGSGPEPVVTGKGKKRQVKEGFYYCADATSSKVKWIMVPEDDLTPCKTKGGKVQISMEAGSCQRAHGPASPGLPKRFLPVIDHNDLPIRQGGYGCRACWDTTTPVYYHEH